MYRLDGNEPCVRYMPGSRYHAADAAVYRCLRALHCRVHHTKATWQPKGKHLSSAALQGHTATQLKVGIIQCMWIASQTVGSYECDRLPVLFAGARLTCSLGTGWYRAPPQTTVIRGVSCLQVPGAANASTADEYWLRCLPPAHIDCSQLSQPLCAGFGTIQRGLVRPI